MSPRYRVLVTAPYFLPVVEEYRSRLEDGGCELVLHDVEERAGEEELLALIAGIDGVICGDDAFTRRVIEAADRLTVIAKWGTGTDSIDAGACSERGIAICSPACGPSHGNHYIFRGTNSRGHLGLLGQSLELR